MKTLLDELFSNRYSSSPIGVVLIIRTFFRNLVFMRGKNNILEIFRELPASYKTEVLDELLLEYEQEGVVLEESITKLSGKRKNKPCPHCHSDSVVKRGVKDGVQSYYCKDCKKWYRETTGTPLYNIQLKDKWQGYIALMEKGTSIKKSAKELKISIQTSFDWRHKILSSLEQFIPDQLSDEVECDEM